ncbi:MAG: SpoIIE family protein phosphatase [Acidobacteria bacterium]|nr:SpoIIE family protein phosphatase [Acidobacteriota bacterium]
MFEGQSLQSLIAEVNTLKSIITNLGEGVIVANRQGRFLLFNRVAEEILGMGATDAAPEEWSRIYGCYRPDKVTPFPSLDLPLVRALAGEHVGETEIFIRNQKRPEGVWITVNASPLRDDAGIVEGGVVVLRNVTVEKEAQEEVRRLTSAVEQTADSILITDKDGYVKYVNPAFELTTGYSRREILGRTPRLLKSGQHDPDFYRTLWSTINSGRPFRATITNRKKNGELYYAEQTITPMRDGTGKIAHFVSVLKDVTEQRKMQEQEFQMRLARTVQQRFYNLPPLKIGAFEIAGSAFPADATGGDYFDFIRMPHGHFGITIADVSGHGFASALLMAELRASLRAHSRRTADPGEILKWVNEELVSDLEASSFITLVLCRIQPHERTLIYSNAGHVPGYVLDARGIVRRVLDSTALPLGLFPAGRYPCSENMRIEPGETLALLTDGITEAENRAGNQFGAERALEFIRAHAGDSAVQIVAGLFKEVRSFSESSAQTDDITAIVCKSNQSTPTRSRKKTARVDGGT